MNIQLNKNNFNLNTPTLTYKGKMIGRRKIGSRGQSPKFEVSTLQGTRCYLIKVTSLVRGGFGIARLSRKLAVISSGTMDFQLMILSAIIIIDHYLHTRETEEGGI